jgi:hypothetical protein
MQRRRKVAAAMVAFTAAIGLTAGPASADHTPQHSVRDRLWSGHYNETAFEQRLGREVIGQHTFVGAPNFDTQATQLQDRMSGTAPVRISLPLLPANDGTGGEATLTKAARGDYDLRFHQIAQIIDPSTREIDLRVMWEANGNWFRWGYGLGGDGNFDAARARLFEQTWARFNWILNSYLEPGERSGRVQLEVNYTLTPDGWLADGNGDPAADGLPNGNVDILGGDMYCMWGHRDAAYQQNSLDVFRNIGLYVGLQHLSISEWSGWADKVTGGVQRGCVETTDPNGTLKSVRFVNTLWNWAVNHVANGGVVEIVPFERDPQPEGEFAMVRPDVEGGGPIGSEFFTWSNGSQRVHDTETAQAFRNTFGVDDR